MNPRFDDAFQSLTGFSPLRWQRRLFNRFVEAGLPGKLDLPTACNLPTGLGKTAIMVIWLLALAYQAATGNVRLPRRLVYIVNRRTVVDQATATVERIRQRLMAPETPEWQRHAETLRAVAAALQRLSASDGFPVGISTLRGQLADNEEWKADPARPAIVIGTIDMIGSKLLFSGYGDGRYDRAHHAGLIGNDTMIVHDETHLAPPFSDLLQAVAGEQAREAARSNLSSSVVRPGRLIEMSATRRDEHRDAFTLEPEDEDDRIVKQRLEAAKRLHLHEAPRDKIAKEVEKKGFDKKKAEKEIDNRVDKWIHDQILDYALSHELLPCKVLIYLRAPEKAAAVASSLTEKLGANGAERVSLLTGTTRAHERDTLVERDPVYSALSNAEATIEKSVYLVCTSAGEVGIDLDADHMVCDLTTLDALIQRLGRVNRRGGAQRTARVDVVAGMKKVEKQSFFDQALAATLKLLKNWLEDSGDDGVEVAPKNLQELLNNIGPHEVESAYSPRPLSPPLTDILLDNWALTSIDNMPGHVEVAPFLHGITADPPETFVAWRYEVICLKKADVEEDSLGLWLRACRIEAREKMHDRSDRVKETLGKLFENWTKKAPDKDFPVVLIDERGNASWSYLSKMKNENLNYRTVVLPVEVGGLDRRGMLDSDSEPIERLDVAEFATNGPRRERWIHRKTPDGDQFERLSTGEVTYSPPEGLREKLRIPLSRLEKDEEEVEPVDLVLYVSAPLSTVESPETASAQQGLDEHTNKVVAYMSIIVNRLGLEAPVREALIAAARWHDKGKDRPIWQSYAHNEGGDVRLAKSLRYKHPRVLGGYRHEFGSLLDAMDNVDLKKLQDCQLALHLIAAHHGWGRPHFDRRAFDSSSSTAENELAFSGVPRRFGHLQQKYGRWGLAWLESLVRCADIVASQSAAASSAQLVGEATP